MRRKCYRTANTDAKGNDAHVFQTMIGQDALETILFFQDKGDGNY